jgi:cytochrome b subunit of formate dehydrogenase
MDPKVQGKDLAESVHRDLECISCHSDVSTLPHQPDLADVNCGSCHSDAQSFLSKSSHSGTKHKKDVPVCKSCHGTHNILPKDNLASKVNPINIPDTCGKCHQNESIVSSHKLPPSKFIDEYKASVHGQALFKAGLIISAVCTDCHNYHDILPANNEKSSIYFKNVPETCGECHLGILKDYKRSIHGRLLESNMQGVPVCTTCHTSHEIKRIDRLMLYGIETKECGGCHADKAPTYQDTFHGQATSLGVKRGALCSDCHTAHLILPASDPGSTINKANLEATCGVCHGKVTANFITFDPHAEPHNKARNPIIYYVYLFMQLLLFSVFGFFGLHDILWLQRSLVAYFKGEYKKLSSEGKWVKRFSKTTRFTHIAIIVSFLGLAATGIPLKFHYAEWAKTFATFLGGVETARYIHKVCAVITFGYGFTHLIYLVYQVIFNRKYHWLFGPDSLVPRAKDLTDMLGNVRWFFYAGERPKIGHWTYWEKFDYFAVFWGIPVIGISGLMLWAPNLFAHFLPGFVLNIASIVHSEEALLAVGFIFMFHFFHTHLRPESFPLDPVIFIGSMPLEKLKEERPEEYELLEKSGELEKLIVEPPSKDLIKISTIFGFIFLSIGLIIMIAILVTFFSSIV